MAKVFQRALPAGRYYLGDPRPAFSVGLWPPLRASLGASGHYEVMTRGVLWLVEWPGARRWVDPSDGLERALSVECFSVIPLATLRSYGADRGLLGGLGVFRDYAAEAVLAIHRNGLVVIDGVPYQPGALP